MAEGQIRGSGGTLLGYDQSEERALVIIAPYEIYHCFSQIALGISKAKEFRFRPTQKDLEELKRETGIWQRASIKSLEL